MELCDGLEAVVDYTCEIGTRDPKICELPIIQRFQFFTQNAPMRNIYKELRKRVFHCKYSSKREVP